MQASSKEMGNDHRAKQVKNMKKSHAINNGVLPKVWHPRRLLPVVAVRVSPDVRPGPCPHILVIVFKAVCPKI